MEFIFILCVIFLLIMLWIGITSDEIEVFFAGIAFMLCFLGAARCGIKLWGEESPKPIDVYRGKTTLEITYRDSVAVDSVVVWKEEIK